jgi:uncharacterized protein YdaU (DUF1376 family)
MSLPRMSLHIGDYHKDTGHLDAALHGAYLLLIMHYWTTGGLPNHDRQLALIARMTPPQWRKARPIIEIFFDDGWRHGRIELELATAREKYDRRVAAGRKGGNAKAVAKHCPSNARAMPEQPITNNPREDDNGVTLARDPRPPLW